MTLIGINKVWFFEACAFQWGTDGKNGTDKWLCKRDVHLFENSFQDQIIKVQSLIINENTWEWLIRVCSRCASFSELNVAKDWQEGKRIQSMSPYIFCEQYLKFSSLSYEI